MHDVDDCHSNEVVVLDRTALLAYECCSQASEGMWGMPGHTEAMKAVVSCDKPGGVAHTQ